MHRKTALFCLLFFGLFLFGFGAPWARTYGGRGYNGLNCIRATADGGHIAVGISSSFGGNPCSLWVLKISASAVIQWQLAFEGYGMAMVYSGCSVQQTADGGYIVAGTYGLGESSGDLWVIKLDPSGNSEWMHSFGGDKNDMAYAVEQTRDGGYVVAGFTESFGAGGYDMWVLKLDPVGQIAWQKTFGTKGDDIAYSIIQTKDGGYLVAGEEMGFGVLLKLGAKGTVQWQKGLGDLGIRAVQELPSGEFVGAGKSTERNKTAGFLVFKINSAGNVMWQGLYGGNGADIAHSIDQAPDGGFVVVGETASFGAKEKDIWILKFKRDGTKVWEKAFGGAKADYAHSVLVDSNGNIIVAGTTHSYGFGDGNGLVLKLTPQGEEDGSCHLARSTASKQGPEQDTFKTRLQAANTNITRRERYSSQGQVYGLAYDICGTDYILSLHAEEGGRTEPNPGDYVYAANSQVTIKATPATNYSFGGWSGDASGSDNPLTITMDSHKYVLAKFWNSSVDWGDGGGGGNMFGDMGGCFIATAAYGSMSHPHVLTLRQFRDRYLLPHRSGRRLVRGYYRISPGLARAMGRHRWLKGPTRLILLPGVAIAYSAVRLGIFPTLAGLAFLPVLPLLARRIIRKKKIKRSKRYPKRG